MRRYSRNVDTILIRKITAFYPFFGRFFSFFKSEKRKIFSFEMRIFQNLYPLFWLIVYKLLLWFIRTTRSYCRQAGYIIISNMNNFNCIAYQEAICRDHEYLKLGDDCPICRKLGVIRSIATHMHEPAAPVPVAPVPVAPEGTCTICEYYIWPTLYDT